MPFLKQSRGFLVHTALSRTATDTHVPHPGSRWPGWQRGRKPAAGLALTPWQSRGCWRWKPHGSALKNLIVAGDGRGGGQHRRAGAVSRNPVGSHEAFPVPPLLQTKQPPFPQPLLTGFVFRASTRPRLPLKAPRSFAVTGLKHQTHAAPRSSVRADPWRVGVGPSH